MKNVLKNRLCLFLILAIALTLCPKVDGVAKDTVGLKPVETTNIKTAGKDYTIKNGVLTIKTGTIKSGYSYWNFSDYSDFTKVTKVVISKRVKALNSYISFSPYTFSSLEEFEVEKGNSNYKVSKKMLLDKSDALIAIPTKVGKSLVIPDSVKDLTKVYFYSSEITSITLGKNVKTISSKTNPYGFFKNFNNLKSIKVATENKNFASKDGVLYTKDMKKLIAYPASRSGKTYNIGSKVTTIGYAAFSGTNSQLKTINVPKTVKKIEDKAFSIYHNKKTTINFKGKAPSKIEKNACHWSSGLTITYPKKYRASWAAVTASKLGADKLAWKAK